MRVTIRQVSGGLIAYPPATGAVSFELDDLPAPVREQAQSLLSPQQVGALGSQPVPPGGADRVQLEFTFSEADSVERFLVDEAACPPELLDLLDELRSDQN